MSSSEDSQQGSEKMTDDGDYSDNESHDEFEDDNSGKDFEEVNSEDEYDDGKSGGESDGEDDDEESGEDSYEEDSDDCTSSKTLNKVPLIANNPIVSQFELFDSLMEMRMKQQEMMSWINKLPQLSTHQDFKRSIGNPFTSLTRGVKRCLEDTLENLLDLQGRLMKVDRIGEETSSKKRKISDDDDEEITSDEDVEMKDGAEEEEIEEGDGSETDSDEVGQKNKTERENQNVEEVVSRRHLELRKYRSALLKEISEKVDLAPTTSKQGNFKSLYIPINKQIDQILEDRVNLVGRTQIKRSAYKVLGKEVDQLATPGDGGELKVVEAKDVQIFDDGDFYYLLMAEMIKRKVANTRDMFEISRRWAELDNLKKKSFRKSLVDQKASKGRRTRYNVIKRLIAVPDLDEEPMKDPKECDIMFGQTFRSVGTKIA